MGTIEHTDVLVIVVPWGVFELAPDLQQRRGVGHLLSGQRDADERAHCLAVLDRSIQPRVAQARLLREANPRQPQHSRHPARRASDPAYAGIPRLIEHPQARLSPYAIGRARELLASRPSRLACERKAGFGRLPHGSQGRLRSHPWLPTMPQTSQLLPRATGCAVRAGLAGIRRAPHETGPSPPQSGGKPYKYQ